MPIKDALATVLNRNAFYRDGYRFLLRVSLIQAGVIVFLIAAIIGLVMTIKPHAVYFATTSDGRIINIVPLNEPYLSQAQVIAWTTASAQNVMRFGYYDYRDRLQQSQSNYFTPTGWTSFNNKVFPACVGYGCFVNADNFMFITVSESCVPIVSFDILYKNLLKNNKSIIKFEYIKR